MSASRLQRRLRSTVAPLAVAVAIAACADAIVEPVWPPAQARLVGQLDGEAFIASASARLRSTPGAPDTLDLFAERWNPERVAMDVLSIRVAFTGPGTYALGEAQVDLRQIVGGDALVGSYAGSRPAPGVLVISSSGEPGALLTGTVQFWLTPSQAGMPDSASVAFTDGSFTVELGAPVGAR